MANRVPEADAVFRDILASYAGSPSIEAKRMFGSDALCVDGKIACFVNGSGRLVAKLPEATSPRVTSPLFSRHAPAPTGKAARSAPDAAATAVAGMASATTR